MAKKPLLKSVVYHISPSYRSSRREQLQAALNAHGAQPAPTISKATHIITDTPRFEGYAEADETAEIVTDRWVERSIVLDRVEPPEMYSADPTMLFSGVTATCTDTIGTLDWVFFVLGTGQLTSPGDRLIHYPVPRRPIEGMPGKVFSITNYTGEARDYLKKLIQGMGAEFNPTMRQGDNPILVAASTESEKAKKGAEWQIPVVNHLWVEDCYMTWRMLPVTGKYITFPPGSDLSGLLCERGMGEHTTGEGIE
ncbi:BRCT domain-containing protein [Schizophyllum fasciatum]